MALTPAERTRRYQERKQAEWATMPPIACACGCGTLIPPINKQGKPATYAHGHNPQTYRWQPGQESWNKGREAPWSRATHTGKKLTPEEIERRKQTRLANNGGAYQTKRGWKHTEETRAKMTEAVRKRDLAGPNNPFYGKKHTPEVLERTGFPSGEAHPNWNGGVATLPYGPEFTRKYKRLIRERDNNTCQRCGKTREQEGKSLEVHHLDHDKMNNDPTNLATSCHACNVWASYHRDEPFHI